MKQTTSAHLQLGPRNASSCNQPHTQNTAGRKGENAEAPPVAQMLCNKCKGPQIAQGRPKGKSGQRQAGRRKGAGGARDALGGRGRRGAGLPGQGGARSSACFLSRPEVAGGADLPQSGPRPAPVFSAPAEATECWAGDPRRRRPLPAALSRWPRETWSPGLSLGAASDKEGSGLSGRTGSAPGLSGDLEPGVRLRALRGGQTSPAPAALKAERTPRAPGSCPRCRRARVSARRAASRPGFEESGGQRGADCLWARRPGSRSGDAAPRRTACPKDD